MLDIAPAGSVCEPEDDDDEGHVDSLVAESHTILVSDTLYKVYALRSADTTAWGRLRKALTKLDLCLRVWNVSKNPLGNVLPMAQLPDLAPR